MKIIKSEILKIKIPFVKPFVTSFGEIIDREIILVKLYDESGEVGFGEAPVLTLPLYNPEIPDGVIALIKNIIFPVLKNKTIAKPEEIPQILNFIKGNEFSKSSIEMAYYDIYCKLKKKRLVDIFKPKKNKLLISATISIHKNLQDTISEASNYLDEDMHYLKLKTKPNFDIKYVAALKENLKNIHLMLDANSSYVLNEDTINLYKKLDAYNLYCIEQPLQSFDIIDHAKLQKMIKTKIALDESIESEYDCQKAIELGSLKLLNIKIARVGGITNALKINNICAKKEIKTWVGGMLESPIGFYANLALSTINNFDFPIDFLGALNYIQNYEKLFNKKPYEIKGDYLHPKFEKTGLGLDLDWELFNTYIMEKITLN